MPTVKYTQEEYLPKYTKLIDLAIKTAPHITSTLAPTVISADSETMSTITCFETHQWMSNLEGMLHGGIITSIFDNGMGSLAIFHNNLHATPTISLTTNYLRAIPIGKKVYLKTSIAKLGKTVIFTEGKIWLEGQEDKICATCSGQFFATDRPIVIS